MIALFFVELLKRIRPRAKMNPSLKVEEATFTDRNY